MMKNWIQFFKHKGNEFRWPLLAGVLIGTTYIPFPPWALVFCYAPLWLFAVSDKRTLKESLIGGWLTQFTLTLIGFHWIAYTAYEYGHIPWIPSILALLLFCALMHLYIPASIMVGTYLRRRFSMGIAPALFSIALTHALLERIWPVIFQWHLGYVFLWAKIPIYHLADLVGFEGLSTLVLLLNAWIALMWTLRENRKRLYSHLGCFVALFVGLSFWGLKHGEKWNDFDREVKVSVIQANIGNTEKIYAEKGRAYQESITQKFLTLTQTAFAQFPESELFIWPETAFPDYLNQHLLDRKNPKLLIEGLQSMKIPLITGAFSMAVAGEKQDEHSTFNALFLIDSNANSLDKPYHKSELLAFGEYLPFSEQFPFLLKIFPFVSNFGRGQGPETLAWLHKGEVLRWGGQVCYEGLYPEFTRGLSKKGANILVNVTNDSWFGYPFEPRQHLYMTLARAIEVRRPLVRSTNTGITTAILANGEVLQHSPIQKEWFGQFAIKYKKDAEQTVFVRWGHWDWILVLVSLILLIAGGLHHARTRRP